MEITSKKEHSVHLKGGYIPFVKNIHLKLILLESLPCTQVDQMPYIKQFSKHPPQIINQLLNSIIKNSRDNSSEETVFNICNAEYDGILQKSDFKTKLEYDAETNFR